MVFVTLYGDKSVAKLKIVSIRADQLQREHARGSIEGERTVDVS